MLKELVPIEWSDERVLTTKQLAEYYDTTTERVSHNFSENKEHFVEGVHYFKLAGAALRRLKKQLGFSTVAPPFSKMANCLYLWTVQGAARHAKMLRTPNVLEIFEQLRRDYFNRTTDQPRHDAIQLFDHPDFGQVRGLNIDGEPWIVGIDAARALWYQNGSRDIERHVPAKYRRVLTAKDLTQTASNQESTETAGMQTASQSKTSGIFASNSMGGAQRLTFINEAGLYKLILRSHMPKAEELSDWICEFVLVSIRKKGFYVKPGQQSLFPDEEPKPKKRRPAPKLAVVYVVEFENATCKIGFTGNLTERIDKLMELTKLDYSRWFATAPMSIEDARQLESSLKARFADYHLQAEFYSAPFDDIKATLMTAPDPRVDKLLAIADRMEPCPERNQLLLQAATLINEKKLL